MSVHKVSNFSDIDFLVVNAAEDTIELSDGKKYQFSDHMCDFCWTGGTVVETIQGDEEYYCILCQNELKWVEFKNDFLPPEGDMLKFLLPASWQKEELDSWYSEFKERRLAQEEVRERILKDGKE